MSFGTLTVGALTYNSVGNGEYMLSTIPFGGPVDMIKLSAGKKANTKAPTSASVTRVIEKDIVENGITTRRRMTVTAQINVPLGFTTTDVDSAFTNISDLVTPSFATRLLLGES